MRPRPEHAFFSDGKQKCEESKTTLFITVKQWAPPLKKIVHKNILLYCTLPGQLSLKERRWYQICTVMQGLHCGIWLCTVRREAECRSWRGKKKPGVSERACGGVRFCWSRDIEKNKNRLVHSTTYWVSAPLLRIRSWESWDWTNLHWGKKIWTDLKRDLENHMDSVDL